MQIYSSYDEEPEDIFLPLSQAMYSDLYQLEMKDFSDDLNFYLACLSQPSHVLEIGCGSGRLTRLLSSAGHTMTGIDLSTDMIRIARDVSAGNEDYKVMDMRRLALEDRFDAVIIPYNTLNLLTNRDDIIACLQGCHTHLKPGGALLLHLYIPSEQTAGEEITKSFQFQMLDRPEGGKVVKEILRTMNYTTRRLEITERYKIRPMTAGQENVNYSHTLLLNGNEKSTWLETLESCGFSIEACYTNYSLNNQDDAVPGLLFINAKCRR